MKPHGSPTILMFTDHKERMLSDCAQIILDIRADLKGAGFVSGFVDFEWMRKRSSDEEWQDLLEFERAYVHEVLFSRDTSKILYSDPGQHSWRTSYFTERIKKRFDEYGSAESLFSVPARRAFIELAKPRQRLMEALEGLTAAGYEAAEERHAMYQRARKLELRTKSGSIGVAREWWARRDATLENLKDFFVSSFPDGQFGQAGNMLINFALAEGVQLALEFDARIEGTKRTPEGKFFFWFNVGTGKPFSASRPPSESDLVHIPSAFPSNFSDYSSFESKEEFVLGVTIWREILRRLVEGLRQRGW